MRVRRALSALVLGLAAMAAPLMISPAANANVGATTLIGTAASSQTVGAAVHDVATLSGGADPTGTITFQAWGPSDTPDCSGNPVFTSTVSVIGNGNYNSGNFTPDTAGKYYWIAAYSGDPGNNPSTGSCGDAGETSTVGKKTTLLATAASSETIGSGVHDVATLSGATANAGGTLTFDVFGPSASADCSGAPVFTDTLFVNGPGDYSSDNFTPSTAGSYYWTATYSGDVNNLPSSEACGSLGETSVLVKRTTGIFSAASSGAIGDMISDSATLSGGTSNIGGAITFSLYGPSAGPDCTGAAVFTSIVPVSGNGIYSSDVFTPDTPGSYYWIASYSGDVNNLPSTGSCGDSGETSAVSAKATTALMTTAASATIGSAVQDTATLTGGDAAAGGTITFHLYGPSASADCSGAPVFTSTVPVSGQGTYSSGNFTPSTAGSYYWVASYSGDAANLPSSGSCGDQGETSTIGKQPTGIGLTATSATVGTFVTGTATLSGATANAGGTLSFTLYGPSASPNCSGGGLVVNVSNVSGSGTYTSFNVLIPTPGSYYWVASYSGDANNQPSSTSCGDLGATTVISKQAQTITFAPLANRTLGVAPFTLAATASSGLTVAFASTTTDVCTVSGTTVTLLAVGQCSIDATQGGDGTWAPAAKVTRSFTVGYALTNVTPRSKSTFKAGSTIPVKFQLATANGTPIPDSVANAIAVGCGAAVTFDGGTLSCAKYSATTHQFQVNIATSASLPRGSGHTIAITVVGGGTVAAATSFQVFVK